MADEAKAPNLDTKPVSVTTAARPSMPSVEPLAQKITAPKTASASDQNVFTELFGADKSQEGSGEIMNTVVAQKDGKDGKKSFFGKKPTLTEMKKPGKAKVKRPGRLVLQVGILLALVSGGFFYTQNSSEFSLLGTNVAQRNMLAEEKALTLAAENHVQRHLSAVLLLDQFANLADEYAYNVQQAQSTYVSKNKRADALVEVEKQGPELTALLSKVQDLLKESIDRDELGAAKEVVDDLVKALQGKKGEVDEATLVQDIRDLESSKTLLQSKDFKNSILELDLAKAKSEDFSAITGAYSQVNQSVSALINSLKQMRIGWSFYVDELEDLAKEADPLFNTEFDGNLHFDSVSFDSTGLVGISGSTATEDTRNFTLVSDFIDILEYSGVFQAVEDRSYRKNASNEDSYQGNFRISMMLEGASINNKK